MTKPLETDIIATEKHRKSTVWTKNKIGQLIQLYRQNECLWNYFSQHYRCKKEREKAITTICTELNITKFEFGKKIHNLRNQFNTENKKLERRIEEAGGDSVEINVSQSCRWEHFESLIFLKDVIEPRPGGFQAGPPSKKMLIKTECADRMKTNKENSVDWTAGYTFNETVTSDETFTQHSDQDDIPQQSEDDTKFNSTEPKSANIDELELHITPNKTEGKKTYFTLQHVSKSSIVTNPNTKHIQQDMIINPSSTQTTQLSAGSVIEIPSAISTTAPIQDEPFNSTNVEQKSIPIIRDQWDAFGQLIATEFHNLNSDVSRRKLKRKIMQAMVEIGEEDDINSS
ncbi:uncharacterized protein LOC119679891 [Teleopsis dalmanni]|uniref:uncharacterized protein LOC119679891 n=1 Tax=Teleopsis dalmanni TaxID=139649 RepID=UPI000D32B93E|nr:uncharacterized protein LOC119679891 [Teleopsis dalmanni]